MKNGKQFSPALSLDLKFSLSLSKNLGMNKTSEKETKLESLKEILSWNSLRINFYMMILDLNSLWQMKAKESRSSTFINSSSQFA